MMVLYESDSEALCEDGKGNYMERDKFWKEVLNVPKHIPAHPSSVKVWLWHEYRTKSIDKCLIRNVLNDYNNKIITSDEMVEILKGMVAP